MNILALDLGTKTGWARMANNTMLVGTWALASPKEIKAQRKIRMDRRLDFRIIRLYKLLKKWQELENIDWIVFEDVQFASTTFQAHLWASLRAAVWIFCDENGVSTECCPVSTLKLFATGSGKADKAQMRLAANKTFRNCRIDLNTVDDNGIDALFLYLWATTILN